MEQRQKKGGHEVGRCQIFFLGEGGSDDICWWMTQHQFRGGPRKFVVVVVLGCYRRDKDEMFFSPTKQRTLNKLPAEILST